jgi:hypothetical protein
MSWAADFGTLHKIFGMDQAAVIDHVRPTGVSGSPTLASYILPSFRAPPSYSSPPTLRPGSAKDNQPISLGRRFHYLSFITHPDPSLANNAEQTRRSLLTPPRWRVHKYA